MLEVAIETRLRVRSLDYANHRSMRHERKSQYFFKQSLPRNAASVSDPVPPEHTTLTETPKRDGRKSVPLRGRVRSRGWIQYTMVPSQGIQVLRRSCISFLLLIFNRSGLDATSMSTLWVSHGFCIMRHDARNREESLYGNVGKGVVRSIDFPAKPVKLIGLRSFRLV